MKAFFGKKKRLIQTVCLVAAILSVALGIFSGLLNSLFFEEKIYMYKNGSEGAMGAYYTLCAIAVAITVAVCAVAKQKKFDFSTALEVAKNERECVTAKIMRMLGGAVLLVGAILRFPFFLSQNATAGIPTFAVTVMLVLFLALAFYLFPEIDTKAGVPAFTAFCGMLGAVGFIIDTLSVYADMSLPIASEYRIMTAAFSVLFMLALVSEMRMRFADPHPYVYIALTAIASTVGGSVCIGRIISVLMGKTISGIELSRAICGLGATLYFISRLIAVALAADKEEYFENCGGIPMPELPVDENGEPYIEDCGGIPYEIHPPIFGEEIENCGGIPLPEDTVCENEDVKSIDTPPTSDTNNDENN